MAKSKYKEPTSFFSEEIRKKYGLGEYNKEVYPDRNRPNEKERKEANDDLRKYVKNGR